MSTMVSEGPPQIDIFSSRVSGGVPPTLHLRSRYATPCSVNFARVTCTGDTAHDTESSAVKMSSVDASDPHKQLPKALPRTMQHQVKLHACIHNRSERHIGRHYSTQYFTLLGCACLGYM